MFLAVWTSKFGGVATGNLIFGGVVLIGGTCSMGKRLWLVLDFTVRFGITACVVVLSFLWITKNWYSLGSRCFRESISDGGVFSLGSPGLVGIC